MRGEEVSSSPAKPKRRRLVAKKSDASNLSATSLDSLGLPKFALQPDNELLKSDDDDEDSEDDKDLLNIAINHAAIPMNPTRGDASKKIADGVPKKKRSESITRRSGRYQ